MAKKKDFDIDEYAKELGITDNQKNFCMNYVFLTALDPYKAYELAGYAIPEGLDDRTKKQWIHKNVMRTLNSTKVRKYLTKLREEMENQLLVDRLYVTKKLKEFVEGNAAEGTKIKALELLGKSMSMFSDKQVIETAEDPGKIAKEAFEMRKNNIIGFRSKEGTNDED